MVHMPVLNHVRPQLHLMGHGSSLVHDCTSPPLRLIGHHESLPCHPLQTCEIEDVHHVWLVFQSPSFLTHGATGWSEGRLDALRTTMLKVVQSWHEAYCSTTSKSFAAGVVRTTHCTHPLSWLAWKFGPTSLQPRWMMNGKGQCGCAWLIPLLSMKSANSRDTNWGPFSFTTCSVKPNAEDTRLMIAMVLPAIVEVISKISGHLEWAFINDISIFSRKRPAKFMFTHCQGNFMPPPRVQWWLAGYTLHCLAGSTCLGECLNVCVYSRPLHRTASKRLHPHHSSMAVMKDVQESLLHIPRNHHPNSPKQTPLESALWLLWQTNHCK